MTGVTRPGDADVAVLSQVIADAFHGLPPSRWLVPDPDQRRAVFPGYFRLIVDRTLAEGIIETTPDRDAAALWIPVSDQPAGPPVGYADHRAAVTGTRAAEFAAFDAALEAHHPAGVPHHYLAILAVRPDRQGTGIGTALLKAHYHHLDQAGTPAYLEASDARTRLLYLRHGYSDFGPPIVLPVGPSMFPMWRQIPSSSRAHRPA